MAKITYANKVALNENPEIAAINKVSDDDLNEIKLVVNTNDNNVGDLTNLTTTTKTNIVAAVNEVNGGKASATDLGNIANLTTTDKTSAVNAINELNSDKAADDIILVQSTEPSSDTNILWINDGQIGTPASEITNSYSESTGIGYSANYSNEHFGGVELYNNTSGSRTSITLSDSVDNYEYIEIYFGNQAKTRNSSIKLMKGCYNTQLKLINISNTSTQQNTQEYYKDINVSGTSITTNLNRALYITSASADYSTATITSANDNLVYIYKVIGYK